MPDDHCAQYRNSQAWVVVLSIPVFKCEEDRGIFLCRISSLPGYENIVFRNRKWHLLLQGEPDTDAEAELQQICQFWNISYLGACGAQDT